MGGPTPVHNVTEETMGTQYPSGALAQTRPRLRVLNHESDAASGRAGARGASRYPNGPPRVLPDDADVRALRAAGADFAFINDNGREVLTGELEVGHGTRENVSALKQRALRLVRAGLVDRFTLSSSGTGASGLPGTFPDSDDGPVPVFDGSNFEERRRLDTNTQHTCRSRHRSACRVYTTQTGGPSHFPQHCLDIATSPTTLYEFGYRDPWEIYWWQGVDTCWSPRTTCNPDWDGLDILNAEWKVLLTDTNTGEREIDKEVFFQEWGEPSRFVYVTHCYEEADQPILQDGATTSATCVSLGYWSHLPARSNQCQA